MEDWDTTKVGETIYQDGVMKVYEKKSIDYCSGNHTPFRENDIVVERIFVFEKLN